MELRAYHTQGVTSWECNSLEHGWRIWANFSKGYWGNHTHKVTVVPKGSPL